MTRRAISPERLAAIPVMRAGAGAGMLGGMKPVPPDRLRDVVDAVLEALDEGLDGPALAARAMLRAHLPRPRAPR
ncbi:MAG TPA: hypothetical protein VIG99_05915, partial [Myxococcaceae bacterium]